MVVARSIDDADHNHGILIIQRNAGAGTKNQCGFGNYFVRDTTRKGSLHS
jgi:hypothetical protein